MWCNQLSSYFLPLWLFLLSFFLRLSFIFFPFLLLFLFFLLLFLIYLFLVFFLHFLLFLSLDILADIIEEGSSPVYFLDIVVVDVELVEEDLVLLARIGVLQNILNLLVALARANHLPEHSIVQIIDVAVDLPPPEVIFNHCFIRVQNYPAVESSDFLHLYIKALAPVEYVGRCEGRNNAAEDLIGSPWK